MDLLGMILRLTCLLVINQLHSQKSKTTLHCGFAVYFCTSANVHGLANMILLCSSVERKF